MLRKAPGYTNNVDISCLRTTKELGGSVVKIQIVHDNTIKYLSDRMYNSLKPKMDVDFFYR